MPTNTPPIDILQIAGNRYVAATHAYERAMIRPDDGFTLLRLSRERDLAQDDFWSCWNVTYDWARDTLPPLSTERHNAWAALTNYVNGLVRLIAAPAVPL